MKTLKDQSNQKIEKSMLCKCLEALEAKNRFEAKAIEFENKYNTLKRRFDELLKDYQIEIGVLKK